MGNNKFLKVFHGIYDYLCGSLNNKKCNFLLIYFVLISILELLAYTKHGMFSFLSSRIWLFGGFICLVSILVFFTYTCILDIKEKQYFSLISVLALIIFLMNFVGNVNLSDINPDSTKQVAAGIDSFGIKDLNYTGKAFLGYPNRQYIIAALPAFLFGRSIWSLQLGFAIPFILGILVLYIALRLWAKRLGIHTFLATIPLYALFVFPYVTEYYMNFEQAIYPISFTMMAIGFFLITLCNPNVLNLFCFAWVGCMLSNSYTPALATLGLMIVFIAMSAVLLLIKTDLMPFSYQSPILIAKSFLFVEINIITFLIATIMNKRDDKATVVRTDIDLWKNSYQSLIDFFTDKNAKFLGVFGIIVIIYVLAGLAFQLKKRDVLLSLWILGVVVAANSLTGYTSYDAAWIMQRTLIIIPVVLVGLILNIYDVIAKHKVEVKNGVIIMILVSLTFIGQHNFHQINQSFMYFNYVQPMKYMLSDLEKSVKDDELKTTSQFNLVIYTDSILLKNPMDYCMFLYPNAKVYLPEYGQFPVDIDLNISTYVYGDREFYAGMPIAPYEMKTFEDKRFKTIFYWYKGCNTN